MNLVNAQTLINAMTPAVYKRIDYFDMTMTMHPRKKGMCSACIGGYGLEILGIDGLVNISIVPVIRWLGLSDAEGVDLLWPDVIDARRLRHIVLASDPWLNEERPRQLKGETGKAKAIAAIRRAMVLWT